MQLVCEENAEDLAGEKVFDAVVTVSLEPRHLFSLVPFR